MTKRTPSTPILLPLALSLAVSLATSGCLKSRLQLREEENDTVKGVPTQVREVQPQAGTVDELKTEVTRLTGRIEELERGRKDASREAAMIAAQKEEIRKVEGRMVELEQAQMQILEAIKRIQHEPKKAAAPSASEGPEIFERAKAQFDAKNFDAAIDAFSNYLRSPKAARAEDATFYRAEAHYELKQFKKAIVDFSRFPEKFTRSKRMPSALLRIGLSFDALGMKDDARGFYQELVEKFPKSPEAKKARTKLK